MDRCWEMGDTDVGDNGYILARSLAPSIRTSSTRSVEKSPRPTEDHPVALRVGTQVAFFADRHP